MASSHESISFVRFMNSPADLILRRHVVGGGVHLGDDNVGITSELSEQKREAVNVSMKSAV